MDGNLKIAEKKGKYENKYEMNENKHETNLKEKKKKKILLQPPPPPFQKIKLFSFL